MAYVGEEVKIWQNKLKNKLISLLGYNKPSNAAFKISKIWSQNHKYGIIEKIIINGEKGSDIPAYLCIPKNIKPPYDTIICLQGHSSGMHNSISVSLENEKKSIEVKGDRNFAEHCLANGKAAICIEQRAFGFREETILPYRVQDRCVDAAMQAILLGKTLLGERITDIQRIIDYLNYRGDINKNTIGILGNSGGATTSMFASAIIPQISFTVISSYFCSFKDSILAMSHCSCNYVPGLYKYAEMSDIAGLIAPRHLVIISAEQDQIFPVKGAKKEFNKLKKIYAAAGSTDKCSHIITKGGHQFYKKETWNKLNKIYNEIG